MDRLDATSGGSRLSASIFIPFVAFSLPRYGVRTFHPRSRSCGPHSSHSNSEDPKDLIEYFICLIQDPGYRYMGLSLYDCGICYFRTIALLLNFSVVQPEGLNTYGTSDENITPFSSRPSDNVLTPSSAS